MRTELESKQAIKKRQSKKQNDICALSDVSLPEATELVDAHRLIPKKNGGKITPGNIKVVDPVAHMDFHGTLRVREAELEELKCVIDDREQVRKLYQKVNNQILAYKRRTDYQNETIVQYLIKQQVEMTEELRLRDKRLANMIKGISKVNAFVRAALGVRGIGPVTVAYCLAYIDVSKARHASCLWSYTGLHTSGMERYKKGVAGGGNRTLRTVLFTMADSQLKTRGAYRSVYDNMKTRLEQSEKITRTRIAKDKVEEKAWKDVSPGHRHGASLRAIMKHFLADYWMIGRKYYGLEISQLYPEAILGGNHRTIQPEERGWVLEQTFKEDCE